MLIRLQEGQIAEYWPEIKVAINMALPPILKGEGDRTNKILESMLVGNAQCWVSVNRDSKKMDGVITTAVVEDMLSGAKSLMLYTIYVDGVSMASSWKEGFETLSKFAKSQGCNRLVGFTKERRILERAKLFGIDTSFTLCVVEV